MLYRTNRSHLYTRIM